MLAGRNSHWNALQRQHLLKLEKKKHSEYFQTNQVRPAFTRMREMRHRTKEDLWSQLPTAEEHHAVVRAETLPEPVCMRICVDWKGGFAATE